MHKWRRLHNTSKLTFVDNIRNVNHKNTKADCDIINFKAGISIKLWPKFSLINQEMFVISRSKIFRPNQIIFTQFNKFSTKKQVKFKSNRLLGNNQCLQYFLLNCSQRNGHEKLFQAFNRLVFYTLEIILVRFVDGFNYKMMEKMYHILWPIYIV